MNAHNLGRIAVFALLASVSFAAARADSTANPLDGYSAYTQYFTIPYANDPHFGSASPTDAFIAIRIGNVTNNVTMDTGSRGFYLSPGLLPGNTVVSGIQGQIYLSSSARIYQGTWTNLTVRFPDAVSHGGAASLAEATLPVLVVQNLTASTNPAVGHTTPGTTFGTIPESGMAKLTNGTLIPYSNHTLSLEPGQVVSYADNEGVLDQTANFGVALDHSGTGTIPNNTDQFNQQFNAFINLDDMKAGTMRAGYIVTQDGVQLGLTANTTGFAYTNLIPTGLAQVPGSPPDWQVPTGNVIFNGTTYGTGQMVLDTGIGYTILTLPGQPTTGNATPPLTVNLLNSNGAVSYEINSDAANILNPANITWSSSAAGPFSESNPPYGSQFLNTGRTVINGFDLVYDATGGLFGLQPNGTVTGANLTFTAAFYPSPVPVPEPAVVVLPALCGALMLGWRLQRKSRGS